MNLMEVRESYKIFNLYVFGTGIEHSESQIP